MARIDVNEKYCVISDPYQWTVYSKSTHKNDQKGTETREGAKAGDERLVFEGSVSTINQAYKFLLHRQIRESRASGFRELMSEVERIEKELGESIRI
ncbi:putative relication initiation protein [Candidatus Desulfosporosinus infrequens]|uniref:Putative relication initiation protein n=1 Tax=Candidatus Desulfosporosinus infrequens TaxID=2043169 RepID=A0A2U3LH49_9FIRM|nr:putative relication initiation protein [Candidatus Desulfosporosinus infrequens]